MSDDLLLQLAQSSTPCAKCSSLFDWSIPQFVTIPLVDATLIADAATQTVTITCNLRCESLVPYTLRLSAAHALNVLEFFRRFPQLMGQYSVELLHVTVPCHDRYRRCDFHSSDGVHFEFSEFADAFIVIRPDMLISPSAASSRQCLRRRLIRSALDLREPCSDSHPIRQTMHWLCDSHQIASTPEDDGSQLAATQRKRVHQMFEITSMMLLGKLLHALVLQWTLQCKALGVTRNDITLEEIIDELLEIHWIEVSVATHHICVSSHLRIAMCPISSVVLKDSLRIKFADRCLKLWIAFKALSSFNPPSSSNRSMDFCSPLRIRCMNSKGICCGWLLRSLQNRQRLD